jgi:hypothetical protein
VRQSTAYQVANNTESGRRQYSLVERARRLGWSDVQVIDDDLGRSGGGIVRPGFEKLLAAICERRVGAVLSIEASPGSLPPVAQNVRPLTGKHIIFGDRAASVGDLSPRRGTEAA